MSDSARPLPLFAAYGIELEYMIVGRHDLAVLPIADELIKNVAGSYVSDTERGPLAWSNELVLHVVELKTNGPAASLEPLPPLFQSDVAHINELLEPMGGRLMPTAMHPWMDPHRETRLWPHEYNPIYASFDRIFGCTGHGWSNLQSMHLNLPFADDVEFARLHAAIRVLLPILPSLAASSPFVEGTNSGLMDARLEAYRTNAIRVPTVSGQIVPEAIENINDYHDRILEPLYRDIAPLDPEGILQDEWLNARGAIARFDRNAIEIRVLDMQECPLADLAIAAAIVAVLKALIQERWSSREMHQSLRTEDLAALLRQTIREADGAKIEWPAYLRLFGYPHGSCSAAQLWRHLITTIDAELGIAGGAWTDPLAIILEHGCLARRIKRAAGVTPTHARLQTIYGELCDCLNAGSLYIGTECNKSRK